MRVVLWVFLILVGCVEQPTTTPTPTGSLVTQPVLLDISVRDTNNLIREMAPDVNFEELSCLSTAVYVEARTYSLDVARIIATVVRNRVISPNYPSTYCSVLTTSRLFIDVSSGGSVDPAIMGLRSEVDIPRYLDVLRLSYAVMTSNHSQMPGIYHYRAIRSGNAGDWREQYTLYKTIDDMGFYIKR